MKKQLLMPPETSPDLSKAKDRTLYGGGLPLRFAHNRVNRFGAKAEALMGQAPKRILTTTRVENGDQASSETEATKPRHRNDVLDDNPRRPGSWEGMNRQYVRGRSAPGKNRACDQPGILWRTGATNAVN